MKKISLFLLVAFLSIVSYAQDSFVQENNDEKYLEKVKTLDGTIKTLYAVISGDAGVERDWDLFHYLFKDGAKLIPSGKNKEGEVNLRYMTPADYVEQSGAWLVKNGFHEIEINRKVETFGNVTHVFSAYEAKRNKVDDTPFMRGTNSIQLLNDGNRWWIVNIYWVQESEENKLPNFVSEADIKGVEKACMNYLEGFYEGDTLKLIACLKPSLHKFGFWKDKTSGEYELVPNMTFDGAKEFATEVLEKKRFAKADAPQKVEILDVKNNIASALVTAYWGVDYILLSRVGEQWMIEEVLWEGPLEK